MPEIEPSFYPLVKVRVRSDGSWLGETADGKQYISRTTYNQRDAEKIANNSSFSLVTDNLTVVPDKDTGEVTIIPSESRRLWTPKS